jgi:serine/threonine protein kinase
MVNDSVEGYLQLMKIAPASALQGRAAIHRDLCLSNGLLDENLDPKVSGFELSEIVIDPTLEQSRHRGTLRHIAPEVLSGEGPLVDDIQGSALKFGEMLRCCQNDFDKTIFLSRIQPALYRHSIRV